MSPKPDPCTPPRIYLVRMAVFLVLAGFVALILYRQIWAAFLANPGLNGADHRRAADRHRARVPAGVRLFREVRWVNDLGRPRRRVLPREPPVLLAPMAALLGNRPSRAGALDRDDCARILDSIGDAPRREPRDRALPRRPAGLPRPARHLLGPDRHRRLGRPVIAVDAHRGRTPALLFDELKSGLAAPLARHGPVVLGLAVRPRRLAGPRLPRPPGRPGAEPLLHRARGLARHGHRSTPAAPSLRRGTAPPPT